MPLSAVKTGQVIPKETKSLTAVEKRCNVKDLDAFTSWVSQPEVCRCCLSTSGSYDAIDSYATEDGATEIYAHMLYDCYSIKLSHLIGSGPSRMVCRTCVDQLRCAYKFKKQVLVAEKHYEEYFSKIENIIKEEEVETQELSEDDDVCCAEIYPDETEQHLDIDPLQETEQEILPSKINVELYQLEIQRKVSNIAVKGTDFESDIPLTRMVQIKVKPSKFDLENNLDKIKTVNNIQPVKRNIDDKLNEKFEVQGSAIKVISGNMLKVMKAKDINGTGNVYDPFTRRIINVKDIKNIGDVGNLSNGKLILGRKDNKNSSFADRVTAAKQYLKLERMKEMKEIANKSKVIMPSKILIKPAEVKDIEKNQHNTPQKSPPQLKQLSERKRIIITCETILKDTTACPFRHHNSWFQCFFCTQDFMEINTLREHTLTTHHNINEEIKKIKRFPRSLQIEISNLKCRHCDLTLTDVSSLRSHLVDAHEKVIYKECIADFKINRSPYSCHLCERQFHVFRTLTTHLNEHYANCICDICGKSFLNSKRLKVHKRTHDYGNYPCKECGKVLKTKLSKANHMETAHSKRIFKCQICCKPMKHYNERVKHMSVVHNITHIFTCPICSREYNVKHYLSTHIRQAHGNKNKKCAECGMGFITNHALKKHMLKHSGIKSYSCDICSKTYARNYTLREHKKIHENLKLASN